MKTITKSSKQSWLLASLICGVVFIFVVGIFVAATQAPANAASSVKRQIATDERLITVHDGEQERAFITKATTLRDAFSEANIPITDNDLTEPGLDEALTANSYEVNVYRARPVTIVDGSVKKRIMTPYRTPQQIVGSADMKLQDEDQTRLEMPADPMLAGLGLRLTIDRATPFTLVLYGKKIPSFTMSRTVADVLQEKKIRLAKNDTLSVKKTAPIKAGMTIEIWRNGKQTITEEKSVEFPVKQIENADKPVGFREVKTPGTKGKKMVTYEIVMKNGQEVKRKEIQSVVTKQPVEQVEIIGTKPNFSGDFAAALAKLRSCEGGYDSWNPAGPYYGAYQFDQSTWAGVSSAPYGNATPAEQDAAARALYERRGWSPWPVCGAGLPDTFR